MRYGDEVVHHFIGSESESSRSYFGVGGKQGKVATDLCASSSSLDLTSTGRSSIHRLPACLPMDGHACMRTQWRSHMLIRGSNAL